MIVELTLLIYLFIYLFLVFPLYCSSTELEASLDLQQRAEKRLRGWGCDLAEKGH